MTPTAAPSHLKHLPGELLTTDRDDADRIFKTDDSHIVDAITADAIDKINDADKGLAPSIERSDAQREALRTAKIGATIPISALPGNKAQLQVDLIRLRVTKTLIDTYIAQVKALEEPKIRPKHLWFPTDNLNVYELRNGNAPSDNYRPKWLRRLRLEIDIHTIPHTIQVLLQEMEANDDRED
jgi:hypothetical protein